MFRITLGMSLALLLAASTSSAQIIAGASVGAGSFGGEFRPPVPAFPLPVHRNTFAAPMHRFGHPAFRPLYPYASPYYFSGFGGGFITSGYYSPYFGIQGPGTYIDDYIPPPAPPSPPAAAPRIVQLSGELPATLTLEFPAPATVWLNG